MYYIAAQGYVDVYVLNDTVGPYTDYNGYPRLGEDWPEGTGDGQFVPGHITFNNAPGNADCEACPDGQLPCTPELCHDGHWTGDIIRTNLLRYAVPIELPIQYSEWTSLDLGAAGAEFVRADRNGIVTFITVMPYDIFQCPSREYADGSYGPTLELQFTVPECLQGDIQGDINADGRVDFKDIAIIADNWLSSAP